MNVTRAFLPVMFGMEFDKICARGGEDYDLLRLLSIRQSHFAIRLRQDAQWVEDGQSLPLSEADRKAGVISDSWVKLGKRGNITPSRNLIPTTAFFR